MYINKILFTHRIGARPEVVAKWERNNHGLHKKSQCLFFFLFFFFLELKVFHIFIEMSSIFTFRCYPSTYSCAQQFCGATDTIFDPLVKANEDKLKYFSFS